MRAFLMTKSIWRYVTGDKAQPPASEPEKLEEYKDMKAKTYGFIFLMLEEPQKSLVRGIVEDPKILWERLETIHLQKR